MKALRFEGSGSEYFKIWIVNILLVIVTLGLYYPWAKVRNNRYFYANTTLEGRNFEYHATGKQLFFGFLIAMVLFILYIIISEISPIGGLVIPMVLFVAIPWLIWRSLKFNMRMTSFSNVRFGFVGGLGESYINFFVYPFLLLLALYGVPFLLGFFVGVDGEGKMPSWLQNIFPILMIVGFAVAFYIYGLIKKKNASYIINGTRYGQGIFMTSLKVRKFLIIALKTLLLGILVMAVVLFLIGLIVTGTVGLEGIMEIKNNMNDPQIVQENIGVVMPIIVTVYLGLILASMIVIAYSMTRQRTYVYENTTLDEKISFASTLQAKPLAWVMVMNFIAVIFTLGLAFPWAKVRMARLMLENTLVDTEHGFDAYVSQKQEEESSLGEQIGDAFDVDVGLGF